MVRDAAATDVQAPGETSLGARPTGALTALLRQFAAGPEPSEPAFAPGDAVDRFELVREIGRGGFGVVFEARDRLLGRRVAFKAIRPGRARDLGDEALQREAEAAAQLTHPNIVVLHDFGRTEKGAFLIMELLEGESLAARLARGRVPLELALELSAQIARALEHAHAAGVLHRDLKPANVFLDRTGRVKVLDFGLAHLFGGGVAGAGGTPGYAAPEQWQSGGDVRSDVYAAAVLLHELVTGERPRGPSSDPAAPAVVVPAALDMRGAPPALSGLLQRALAADPAERPQDAAAWRLGVEEVQRALLAARAGPVSVAVLPVVDLGAGAGEHLADALTELLIAQLARDRLLRVISRSTAMAYRGSSRPIPQIGRELSVGSVVEGSILRVGGELQLVVKLVEVTSDRPIWSDRLGFAPEGALAVVERAAAEIGRELHARVGGVDVGEGARAVAPRALDAHVRGQYHLGKRTAQALATALVEFQAALDADPRFAAPHVGAAHAHIMSGIYGFEAPRTAFGLAREHAERALALDPHSGEATGALASVHLFHDYDFPAALELARRAAELNPSYAVTHLVLGDVLLVYERFDEALEQLELAIRLDPLDRGMRMNVGDFLSWAGDQRAAARQLRGVLELDPHHLPSHVRLARILALLGDRRAGLEELAIVSAGASRAVTLETTALCQAALGEEAAARAALEDLERLARAGRASALAAANARAALRDRDAALEWLGIALEERSPMLPFFHLHPPTRVFRDDPAFAALGRRIGIPRFVAAGPDVTP